MHIGRAEKIRLYGIDCPEKEQLTVTRPSSSPPRWCSARWSESRSRISTLTTLPNTISEVKDRKSTRLNSSHVRISYAVFCLKKKTDRGVLVCRHASG